MKHLFFVIFAALFSQLAQAQLPPGTKMAFRGTDSQTGAPCFLFVYNATGNNNVITSLTVGTSYNHNNEFPQPLMALPVPNRMDVMVGATPDQKNQIALFFAQPNNIQTLKAFNLRWWHVNHAHNYQCVNLLRVK